MKTITSADAQDRFGEIFDQLAIDHEPILIKGRKANAVLIAEQDWKRMQENLCLVSLPGNWKSSVQGAKALIENCTETKLSLKCPVDEDTGTW